MRKFTLFSIIISVVVFIILCVYSGCSSDSMQSTDMSYNNLKSVSLRELQNRIRQGDNEEFQRSKSFYGITKLYGFLWDEEGNDLILIGEADNNKPPLHFDDFVVSLRNAYCFYCEHDGNTMYYRDPSCTIDPDPKTWDTLDDLINRYENQAEREQIWKEICGQPQSVGVFGIPYTSHLASTMVIADYLLKDIVNGNLPIEIDGFKSLHQIRREIVEEAYRSKSERELGSPINRFEITAQNAYFKYSENLYLLYSLPLVLVTEEEYRTGEAFSGTGKSDPLAKEFADSFTSRYKEISNHLLSKDVPVYEILEQSYRVFAIANAIRESGIISDTSFFSALFHHYPLDSYDVPESLPGKSLVDAIPYATTDTFYTEYLYSCGGVNLKSVPQKSMIRTMMDREIMHSVLQGRSGIQAVEWNAIKLHSKLWVLNINRFYMHSRF